MKELLEEAFQLYIFLSGRKAEDVEFGGSGSNAWIVEDASMFRYGSIGTTSLHYKGKDFILKDRNRIGMVEVVDGKVYIGYHEIKDGKLLKVEEFKPWMKCIAKTAEEFCKETGLELWSY